MQIVTLVVRHDCPMSRPVVGATNSRVAHLFHRGEKVVLEIHGHDSKDFTRLLSAYDRMGGEILYEEQERVAALVRFPSCACCKSGGVIPTIEGAGHQYLPPCRYSSEGERYQFLVLERKLETSLLDRLPSGVSVVRVRTKPLASLGFEGRFLVPVGVLFAGLTDRQRQAIVLGILQGYFRIPRGIRSEQLARRFGISRPAFDTLLRKAENRIVAALLPYLTALGPGPLESRPPT